jgi:prolyl oligopeptidase
MVNDFWTGSSFVFTKDRMLVPDIVGGPSQVRVFDLAGERKGTLPAPELTSISNITALSNGDVVYAVTSYLRPRSYARWKGQAGGAAETKLGTQSPVAFDDAEVIREFAVSKDGTRVPVTVIRRKGAPMDGGNPTVLTGYGGYGISTTPAFLGPRWRLWLDAGGVFAEANIRGGAEYGQEWHTQGNLTHKQNVFDDFAAAAQLLIDRKYTKPARLALMGGSNGGLLVGATMVQHPGLARAVVSSVGLYDMVRAELEPNGVFNITEFGTVKDPAQFKALYAYSPYHHVAPGARYPAVLLLTGANDGRVNPWQSRKFAAALQAATASEHPILLRVSQSSGHGMGSALDERIDQQADILAFLYGQFDLK